MRKRLLVSFVILISLALFYGQAMALSYEDMSVAQTAKTMTATTYKTATTCFISIESYAVYFTFDGTTPTTGGAGHYGSVGTMFRLTNTDEVRNFTVIAPSGTAHVKCTCE
jgi:hypothetical protein